MNRSRLMPNLRLGAALSALFASGVVYAADTAPPAGAQANSVDTTAETEAIIVTGSRVVRSTFSAPTPITVMNSEDIAKLGLTNAADIVAELPQNARFVGASNSQSFNTGAELGNLRGLNPFFGTRTLTLVDTRRFVPTTDTGAVDLNIIPSMLISRIETVTGGASAAYGSDAVAGVINIILDTKLDGFKAQLDSGLTFRGDGGDIHGSAAYGTKLGDRGHIIFGGEYEDAKSIGRCSEVRAWCRDAAAVFTNPNYAATPAGALFPGSPAIPANGQPHYVIGSNARISNTSGTGVFPFAGPFGTPVQFNNAGTSIIDYAPGLYAGAFPIGPLMQGGGTSSGADAPSEADENPYRNFPIRPRVRRISLLAHMDYDVSDGIQAYLEGSFAQRKAVQQSTAIPVSFAMIAPDNAFLTPEASAALFPAGLASAPQPFNRDFQNLPASDTSAIASTWRAVAGLKGDFSSTWGWDVYYTYGHTVQHQVVTNTPVTTYLAQALDAVSDGAGNIVCRDLAARTNGCVPLNLFGAGNADPAALAYTYRTLYQDLRYTQQVLSGNIHGDLSAGWGAGAISFAGGIEYRRETSDVTHRQEDQSYYRQFQQYFGEDYHAHQDVLEGYAEVSVPILRDQPFFKSLSVDGAIRQTRNKATNEVAGTSHTVDFTTWKVSGSWDVNDWLRLRANRSRDVRSPSFYELYAVSVQGANPGNFFASAANPINGGAVDAFDAYYGGADPNTIQPEKADTWTVGAVLTGHGALEGLQASVDWYQIDLKGALTTPGGLPIAIISACYFNNTYCDQLAGTGPIHNGAGSLIGYTDITRVDIPYQNLSKFLTRGIDVELGYNLRLNRDGALNFRLLGTYLYDRLIDTGSGAGPVNYAGVTGAVAPIGSLYSPSPKFQGSAMVSYLQGKFTGTVQVQYIGSAKLAILDTTGLPLVAPGDAGYDPTLPNSISSNHVNAAAYVNLSASYDVTDGFSVFGVVNNVLDKKPPFAGVTPAQQTGGYPTNPVYFDTYGASWKVGVRVRF